MTAKAVRNFIWQVSDGLKSFIPIFNLSAIVLHRLKISWRMPTVYIKEKAEEVYGEVVDQVGEEN